MIEASHYSVNGKLVTCNLCPHNCVLESGKAGICKVRMNKGGKLLSMNYNLLSAVNVDPIEKKPLFHFMPGKQILSIGSVGCNLKCSCCQNWEIAQVSPKNFINNTKLGIDEIVEIAASRKGNIGLAYTYNEPVVWYEYMIKLSGLIKKAGLKNVMVSNGYVNEEPLDELINYIDAFNIDIKAFSEEKYKLLAKCELEPVKRNIAKIVKSEKHIELTNLLIPGVNDTRYEFKEMIKWIYNELGNNTVLHLSRYFPSYKMNEEATPVQILQEFYEIASDKLNYVYLGNVNSKDSHDTFCAECNKKVIERNGFYIKVLSLDNAGKCDYCGNVVMKNI